MGLMTKKAIFIGVEHVLFSVGRLLYIKDPSASFFFFDVGRNIHVEHYANMDKTRSGNFLCFKGGQEADDNLLQFSV